VGGVRNVEVVSGSLELLLTEVATEELNRHLSSGAYDVFVQVDGNPTPGWMNAGRIVIPLP